MLGSARFIRGKEAWLYYKTFSVYNLNTVLLSAAPNITQVKHEALAFKSSTSSLGTTSVL